MKRLYNRLGLYLLLLTCAFIAVLLVSGYVVKSNFGSAPKSNIHSVILGHSHAQCAYDDSKMDGYWNFSGSGESYLYTLAKVNYLLEMQPHIQHYYIEFSNNHINSGMNNKIWSDSYINTHYSWAFPYLGYEEHLLVASHNSLSWLKSWSFNCKRSISLVVDRQMQNTAALGGKVVLKKWKVDSLLTHGSPFEGYDWTDTVPCMANIRCLEQITNKLIQADKKVTLIRSPLHSAYPGRINEAQFQKIRLTHFPAIPFLDYSNFALANNEMGDLGHLNIDGSQRFTAYCDSAWAHY